MAPNNKPDQQAALLNVTITSTIDLFNQFESSLLAPPSSASNPSSTHSPQQSQRQDQDPLKVLAQCAVVVKAHTTKLSLMFINEPFSPTAIANVLRELSTGALPTLLSAAQACSADIWGQSFHDEVKSRTRRLLWELKSLLSEASARKGHGNDDGKQKKNDPKGSANAARDEILSAGVIWEACDQLAQLEQHGVAGVVAAKAQEYYEMLEDAISELKEWGEEEEDAELDEELSTDGGKHQGENEDIVEPPSKDHEDLLFEPSEKLSKDDKSTRAQLETTLKKLNHIKLLYRPIIKRRLKKFPLLSTAATLATAASAVATAATPQPISSSSPLPTEARPPNTTPKSAHNSKISKLNEIMHNLQSLQSETDELAAALYDGDGERASDILGRCVTMALRTAEVAQFNWDGTSDEFGRWLGTWKTMI